MWQREVIFGTGSVEVAIVNANPNFSVLLGHWHYVGDPIRIYDYSDEFRFMKLVDLLFDFEC